MLKTPDQAIEGRQGGRPLGNDLVSLEELQEPMQGSTAASCSGGRRLGATTPRQVPSHKTIHHLGSNLLRREIASSEPKPKMFGGSEILLNGATQIPRAL
jgi:hypothetical protein